MPAGREHDLIVSLSVTLDPVARHPRRQGAPQQQASSPLLRRIVPGWRPQWLGIRSG